LNLTMLLSTIMFIVFATITILLCAYGLVDFPRKLLGYIKKKEIEPENKLFPLISTIIYIVSMLMYSIFLLRRPAQIIRDIFGGADIGGVSFPFPIGLNLMINSFLSVHYWSVGVIPILLLILLEFRLKGIIKTKVLVYSFIRFLCVLIFLFSAWALFVAVYLAFTGLSQAH
jgi:hypothetical protein